MEVDASQDVLATLRHHIGGFQSTWEPWSRTFRCEKVNFEPVVLPSILASGSSVGSRALPSLREECADFAQLGSTSFCIASIETTNGIEFLFGRLFKVLRRVSVAPNISAMEEFMQVLGMVEFVGMKYELDDVTANDYHSKYTNFLARVGRLQDSLAGISLNGCSQNITFHAALFAWHVACKLLNRKPESPDHNRILSGDEALALMLDGLAVLRRHSDSSVPCSCVQSVLVDLYCNYSSQILRLCFQVMQCLMNKESTFPQTQKFGTLSATAAEFFQFFAEMVSHFIDIRLIQPEEIMSRFVLLVGIGELLCDKEPLPTFKVLFSFMKKYQLKGLAKIRKSASKFVLKILQVLEGVEIAELDELSRGDPSRWAKNVKSSFVSCVDEEVLLIQFLLQLLSDDELCSCRGILTNRYSNAKFLLNGCVLSSVLSLLLAVFFSINDRKVLAGRLCEWIAGSIQFADETQCEVLFNALEVLGSITSELKEKEVDIPNFMATCLNALPLPERSMVFGRRCSVMARTHPKHFPSVDIDRFVSAASSEELVRLLRLLSDVDVEISGSIWDRALDLLVASNAADPYLRSFVINQLVVGMRNKSSQSLLRFKTCTGRLNCVQPDVNFLFTFCNGLLSRLEGQHLPTISQLLPIWIYAVLAYSKSRELDTKGFTSMIWDHISWLLRKLDTDTSLELSPGNSEAFLIRFFTILGNNLSSDCVRKIIADAVPFQLASQMATLLKKEERDMQERVIRVCCEILHQIGPTLLAIAEEEAPRTGLNRTAFVVLTQALVSTMVRSTVSNDFLLQFVPVCVSALARLPYRMFINSRIKDLLLKFGNDSAFLHRIVQELSCPECSVHYSQLKNDSDERIKRLLKMAE
ncbi:hypothetical protein RB195_006838 [Necator americanus]